ncbi:MAG: glycerophosphodiester phosphodiesterase [Candidatus Hydrogenedentes bacterium]|nr:glycerophosphodiester phosphodiesterase [Candidatus Hydrogenedentota bacterium]
MGILLTTMLMCTSAEPATNARACAHRGDKTCAPENTVPAFVSAVKKGAHMIEFDVHLTKDGHDVIIHDGKVDRTTDGTGAVADLTFDEIRALDAGTWFDAEFAGTRVPTLRETLDVIPHTVLCNVHLKNAPGVAERAATILVEMERLDHCFLACSLEQAEVARQIAPEIKICNMSRQSGDRLHYVADTIESGAEFIQLLKNLDGLKEVVDTLHAQGVVVNYFVANEPDTMRVLIDAGVDYLLTDKLDTCLEVLAEYGVEPLKPAKDTGEAN